MDSPSKELKLNMRAETANGRYLMNHFRKLASRGVACCRFPAMLALVAVLAGCDAASDGAGRERVSQPDADGMSVEKLQTGDGQNSEETSHLLQVQSREDAQKAAAAAEGADRTSE